MRGQNTFQDYSPLPFPFLQSEIRMVGHWWSKKGLLEIRQNSGPTPVFPRSFWGEGIKDHGNEVESDIPHKVL